MTSRGCIQDVYCCMKYKVTRYIVDVNVRWGSVANTYLVIPPYLESRQCKGYDSECKTADLAYHSYLPLA